MASLYWKIVINPALRCLPISVYLIGHWATDAGGMMPPSSMIILASINTTPILLLALYYRLALLDFPSPGVALLI